MKSNLVVDGSDAVRVRPSGGKLSLAIEIYGGCFREEMGCPPALSETPSHSQVFVNASGHTQSINRSNVSSNSCLEQFPGGWVSRIVPLIKLESRSANRFCSFVVESESPESRLETSHVAVSSAVAVRPRGRRAAALQQTSTNHLLPHTIINRKAMSAFLSKRRLTANSTGIEPNSCASLDYCCDPNPTDCPQRRGSDSSMPRRCF